MLLLILKHLLRIFHISYTYIYISEIFEIVCKMLNFQPSHTTAAEWNHPPVERVNTDRAIFDTLTARNFDGIMHYLLEKTQETSYTRVPLTEYD